MKVRPTNSCKMFYFRGDLQAAQHEYTASRSHTENEDLAKSLVTAYKKKSFELDTLWYDFTRDPRYKAPKGPGDPVLMAAEAINRERSKGLPVQLDYYYGIRSLGHEGPFFITWKRLGIRAINRLISKRIKFAGLFRGYAEGRHFTKKRFFQHDLSHADYTHIITSNNPFLSNSFIKSDMKT